MNNRTKGAWIINHTKRLSEVENSFDFEEIDLAGKCGILLSNLAASDGESLLTPEMAAAVAKASRIKKTEIETIKQKLQEARLIDCGRDGSIAVLGITTAAVLDHTSEIFDSTEPNDFQKAALEISESVSDLPKNDSILKDYIADQHHLSRLETGELFSQAEEIGFIDFEKLDGDEKLYFNGNLFRRNLAEKTHRVLATLTPEETRRINQVDQLLVTQGCAIIEDVTRILGIGLLGKLQSIGMYDISEVSNIRETKAFVTKPAAFSKYGNPFEEDALDLAKAFVSSLYYGINYSSEGRGKIAFLSILLRKLLRGEEVGPATAIGQDYKILELKRVISLRPEPNSSRYYMKLLKRDVGELALQVLEVGDAAEKTVQKSTLYTGDITDFKGPEQLRRRLRRKRQNPESKIEISRIIRTFRTNE